MACGPSSGNSPSPAASPSVSPSPSASPSQLACTTTGPASSTWPAPDKLPSTPVITSVTVSGDALTITFAQGTPSFEVSTQPNAHFVTDPSGQPVDLTGSAGVRIVLRGFRGDLQNYTGSKTLTSQGPLLLQVSELGDNEGVITWGEGVASPACTAVTSSGSTLTFQFIRQPAS
jgi:hypothetical protein